MISLSNAFLFLQKLTWFYYHKQYIFKYHNIYIHVTCAITQLAKDQLE